MKSYTKELWYETKKRYELIDITGEVEDALAESGIEEGMVLVNAMQIALT